MKQTLKFEKIDPNNTYQAKAFVSWHKDPEMIKNWVIQKEEKKKISYSIEDFKAQFSESEGPKKIAFMVQLDDRYIGYAQFYINHVMCLQKEGRVAWPSIAIGESEYRGRGFGLAVAKEILRLAKDEGCTHVEAAIFEFNEKIKNILLKSGFEFIGKKEVKTFVDSKWWGSEHYLLKL